MISLSDGTNFNGIEVSADVTDTTNVDSSFDNLRYYDCCRWYNSFSGSGGNCPR